MLLGESNTLICRLSIITWTDLPIWVGPIQYSEGLNVTKRQSYGQVMGFPGGSAGKESACHVGDMGLIHGLGRSPGKGKGYPLQYSGLENSMDCIVHGVAKSRTRLSNFHVMGNYLSLPDGFPAGTLDFSGLQTQTQTLALLCS